MLITANNHATDQDKAGLMRTIKVIQQNELHYVGTAIDSADSDSVRVLTTDSIGLGMLAYTYGTNNQLLKNSVHLNHIESSAIADDILRARKQGANVVLVYLHYGQENSREPSEAQQETVQQCIAAGADIIIGCHTHVIGPIAYKKADGTAVFDSAFIAYGMGNFISNQYWRYTDAGLYLELELERNNIMDSTYLKAVRYLPTWVYRSRNAERRHHTILPAKWAFSDTLPDFIDTKQQVKMKEAYDDTRDILLRYSNKATEIIPLPYTVEK